MRYPKNKNSKIIIAILCILIVAATAIAVTFFVKNASKEENTTASPSTTKPVATTSPYVLLSDIDREFHNKQIIGRVVSEDLNVNCNLIFGTTDECLSLGAGLHKTSSIPGYTTPPVIAGHCQTVFKGFKNAEVGDTITVEMPYGDYTYKISEIKIMDKNEFDFAVLREPIKKAIFYTCYPFEKVSYVKTDRMFLYCDYISGDRILDDVNFTVPDDVTNKYGALVNQKKDESTKKDFTTTNVLKK